MCEEEEAERWSEPEEVMTPLWGSQFSSPSCGSQELDSGQRRQAEVSLPLSPHWPWQKLPDNYFHISHKKSIQAWKCWPLNQYNNLEMEILDILLFRKQLFNYCCGACIWCMLECGHTRAGVWTCYGKYVEVIQELAFSFLHGFQRSQVFRVAKPFHWPPDIFPFLKNTYFHFMGIGVSFCTCVWSVPGAHSQRRTSAPPVLEVQMAVRWRMGARNPTQVLCRSRKSLSSTRPLPAPRYISWLTLRHKLISIWPWNML